MVVLQKARVWSVPVYVVLGCVTWFALLQSGVHATLAGVAIGLLTPGEGAAQRGRRPRATPARPSSTTGSTPTS